MSATTSDRDEERVAFYRSLLAERDLADLTVLDAACRTLKDVISAFSERRFVLTEIMYADDVTAEEIEAAEAELAVLHRAADTFVGWLEGEERDELCVRAGHARMVVNALLGTEELRHSIICARL